MNNKRKQNRVFAKRIEETRRLIEGMGIDCRLGVALHEQGVSFEELRMLAKGNVAGFLKKTKGRVRPEQEKQIIEKYLR